MKQFIKTTCFVLLMGSLAIYSKTISSEVVESYNNCVAFLANNTVGNSSILGI